MNKIIAVLVFLLVSTSVFSQKKDNADNGQKKNEETKVSTDTLKKDDNGKKAPQESPVQVNESSQGKSDTKISEGASGVKRSISYKFDSELTSVDPGKGSFRYNTDTISRVSFIYVDNVDLSGEDQTKWYSTWDDVTGAMGRGRISIVEEEGKKTDVFDVTGLFIKEDGFWKIPVKFVSGSLPVNGATCYYIFERIENKKENTDKEDKPDKPVEGAQVKQPEPTVEAPVVVQPAPQVEVAPVAEPVKPVEVAAIAEPAKPADVAPVTEAVKPVEETPVPEPAKPAEVAPVTEAVKPVEVSPVPEPAKPVEETPIVIPVQVIQAEQNKRTEEKTTVSKVNQPVKETPPAEQPKVTQTARPAVPRLPEKPALPNQQPPKPPVKTQPVKPAQQTQQAPVNQPKIPEQVAQPKAPVKVTQTTQISPAKPPVQQTNQSKPAQTVQNTQITQTKPAFQPKQPAQQATQISQPAQYPGNNSATRPLVTTPGYNTGVSDYSGTTARSHGKCYHGIIEIGYAAGIGKYGIDNFRFNFINGIYLCPTTSIGLGIGYRHYSDRPGDHPDWTLVSGVSEIPVFLDFRTTFTTNKVTPYLAFGIGGTASYASGKSKTEGLYLSPSGGIWFNLSDRFAVFAGVAYELQRLEYELTSDNSHFNKNASSLSLNLGISF
jgi:hypothetical protein